MQNSIILKENYSSSSWNNVIQCRIKKNGREYYTSKRLMFGQAGTTGTDATVRIYFEPAYWHALRAKEGGDTLKARVVLFDSQNQEVDLNEESEGRPVQVSWKWIASDGTPVSIVPYNATAGTKKEHTTCINDSSYYNSTHRDLVTLEAKSKIAIETTFLILQVTITGWGDYSLTTCRPVPVAAENFTLKNGKTYVPTYIDGAEEIVYSTTGYPNYYKQAWALHYNDDNDQNTSMDKDDGSWSIYRSKDGFSGEFGEDAQGNSTNILKPLSFYVSNTEFYGAQFKQKNGPILWSQPIYICQNNYPSGTVNKWDGKSLVLDKDNGTILSTAIAAGKKDSKNKFSGVIIGAWDENQSATATEIAGQTGVYGFHEGEVSYAFTDDGKAFIGKSGHGRLLFNGNTSTITSELYASSKSSKGMILDFNNGLIKLCSSTGNIEINAKPTGGSHPFTIGSNFSVEWDGTLHASNGDFDDGTITGGSINIGDDVFTVDSDGNLIATSATITGTIYASAGKIGGFTITNDALYSNKASSTFDDTTAGVFLGSDGKFALGQKFRFDGDTLFIATNIYRKDTTNGKDDNSFLIGINNSGRLQIGSASTTTGAYDGVSIYGNGDAVYIVPTVNASNPVESSKRLVVGKDYFRVDGYDAEHQVGIYARFA